MYICCPKTSTGRRAVTAAREIATGISTGGPSSQASACTKGDTAAGQRLLACFFFMFLFTTYSSDDFKLGCNPKLGANIQRLGV